MSVKLFKYFVNTLRQNLPKYPKKGYQVRYVTAMDVAQAKEPQDIVPNKESTRYKKRFMKRQWEDLGPRNEDDASKEKKICERIKRKKMAMLLGYCGVDYFGMQRNPGVRTIEEDLLKALWDAKYVTEEDFNNQQNAQFQRSSRTDKGVSAARQVVSLKLPLEVNIEEINKRLPECIKVFGIKRVTNKFNSKVKCNARSYSYTLPTYTFESNAITDEERKHFRITPEKLAQVTNVLENYKGTKSYHNFTEKKHYQDPSASRYMMGFGIEKVFTESDMEFAVLVVKGQSFMLHQIRKMVGLAIAIVRGVADSTMMEKAFGKDKVIIPTAPGLGLVLDMVHYDRYDNKFKDSHDSLTWEAEEEAVQKFKHDHIYPVIVKGELEGGSIGLWLEKLNQHSFEPSDEGPVDKIDKELQDGDDDKIDDEVNEVVDEDGDDEVFVAKEDVVSDEIKEKCVGNNDSNNVTIEEKNEDSKDL